MKNEKWKIKGIINKTNSFVYFLAFILLLFFTSTPAHAFEDCIIINNSKLTDIKIEDNSIIDVFPLITIMNEKNTLIVHPLKTGETRFSVLKDGKNIILFNVKVSEDQTYVEDVKGFEIFTIDCPPGIYEYELDAPPEYSNEVIK